jgi:hypothetical protein
MKPKPIEFLGGPLDGVTPPLTENVEQVPYRQGDVIHLYTVDEIYEGKGVRKVFRHTGVFNIGDLRRGKTDSQ